MPREKLRMRRLASDDVKLTSSSISSTRRRGRPMVSAAIVRISRPVRPACWAEASRRTPTSRPGLGRSANRSPLMVAVPDVGTVRPTMTRIVVDLPAPFGPRKPVTRPGRAVKETLSTAVKPAYLRVSDSTVIMGQPSPRRGVRTSASRPDPPPPLGGAGSRSFARSPRPRRSLGWAGDHQRPALSVGRAPRSRRSRTAVARLGAGRRVDGDGGARGRLPGRRRLAAVRDDRGSRTGAGAAVAAYPPVGLRRGGLRHRHGVGPGDPDQRRPGPRPRHDDLHLGAALRAGPLGLRARDRDRASGGAGRCGHRHGRRLHRAGRRHRRVRHPGGGGGGRSGVALPRGELASGVGPDPQPGAGRSRARAARHRRPPRLGDRCAGAGGPDGGRDATRRSARGAVGHRRGSVADAGGDAGNGPGAARRSADGVHSPPRSRGPGVPRPPRPDPGVRRGGGRRPDRTSGPGRRGGLPAGAGGADQRAAARPPRLASADPSWRGRGKAAAKSTRRRPGRPGPTGKPRLRAAGDVRARAAARRHAARRARARGRVGGRRRAADGGTPMTVRVLVADDQDLVRTGLSMILDAQPDIEVVGQAADGHAAVELARRLRPDVCLVDIRMPGLDGIEVTELLAGRGVPDPMAVVVITTFDLDEYVHGALRAGARGFLLKDAGPELLVQAVHAAAVGDALIAPNVTRRLLAPRAPRDPGTRRTQPTEPLTDREEEVLALVARGRTNAEIAADLFIGLTTAKTHVASLLAKIGARNRVEIAMWAYDTGRAGD